MSSLQYLANNEEGQQPRGMRVLDLTSRGNLWTLDNFYSLYLPEELSSFNVAGKYLVGKPSQIPAHSFNDHHQYSRVLVQL